MHTQSESNFSNFCNRYELTPPSLATLRRIQSWNALRRDSAWTLLSSTALLRPIDLLETPQKTPNNSREPLEVDHQLTTEPWSGHKMFIFIPRHLSIWPLREGEINSNRSQSMSFLRRSWSRQSITWDTSLSWMRTGSMSWIFHWEEVRMRWVRWRVEAAMREKLRRDESLWLLITSLMSHTWLMKSTETGRPLLDDTSPARNPFNWGNI